MNNPWYKIQAGAGAAKVYIFDTIAWFGVTANEFVRELDEITASQIDVHINSDGGDVFDGIAIFNALKHHKAKIVVHVDGVAASIASVIAMAGDEVIMAEGSFLMIHEPWMIAVGNATEMLEAAGKLNKVSDTLVGVYTRATGASERQVRTWMAAETWFNAAEAVTHGFADSAETNVQARIAAWSGGGLAARFRNMPERVAAKVRPAAHVGDWAAAAQRLTSRIAECSVDLRRAR